MYNQPEERIQCHKKSNSSVPSLADVFVSLMASHVVFIDLFPGVDNAAD